MPARARRVTSVPAEPSEETLGDVTDLRPAPRPRATRAKAAARRVTAATSETEVRLPAKKRAVETAEGELAAPIRGKYFPIQPQIALMPLMEWAASADGVSIGNFGQLTGLFRLLTNVVDPDSWDEFRTFVTEERCDGNDFILFVNAAIEALSAYPTEPPAAS